MNGIVNIFLLAGDKFITEMHLKQLAIFLRVFWDFLMFNQIFFSQQVKRSAIITYKHGIYELPQEFPHELKLRILGN